MSHNYRYRRKQRVADMNVVPYIDVMLVLLIIFMITSPLLTESIDVELPYADTGATPIEPPQQGFILISMNQAGEIFLQDSQQALHKDALLAAMQSFLPNSTEVQVFIKADQQLAYGEIIAIMDILKGAGIEKVSLVTQSKPTATDLN